MVSMLSGGPGWVNDIFKAEFVFESSSYTLIDDDYCVRLAQAQNDKSVLEQKVKPQVKCFDGRGALAGKLVITPPEGKDVSHNGVEITFTSTVDNFLETEEHDVIVKKWVLLEPGSIAEPIEVTFDIDLSEIGVRDTFTGAVMALRHSLNYRIVRPWYTFAVRGEEHLAIRYCAPPPDAPPPPDSTVLTLDDFGGVCAFDHGRCTFACDGRLVGAISFTSMQHGVSIAEVAIVLGRTEMWKEGSGRDVVVREYMLHSPGQSPISHDVAIPVDVSLTAVGSEPGGVEGALPPSMCPLVPSDPETQAEHKVEVAYWLRLILKGAAVEAGVEGNKYWTTHPLLLEPSTEAGSV